MQLTEFFAIALTVLAVVLTLALSSAQSFIGANVGSDHPVHVFLTKGIRDNGFRLFVRIPRLLNTCYCAAVPLYIHWLVSHFRAEAIFWSERLLNPVVNTLHVAVFVALALIAADQQNLAPIYVALATCAFALTPQFYHALSARNFGLSSRGTGLLLLTLFLLAGYCIEAGVRPALSWPALIVAGWLIWGFSTFGAQALCIISSLLLVTTGRPVPLLGAGLGLGLFIVLHPAYSVNYVKHTLRFIRTYAVELAPIYILNRRHSVWRDLVWDIWARMRAGLANGLRYAYENSFVVVVLLNPLVVVASAASLGGGLPPSPFVGFAGAVAVAGLAAVVLTSFRLTRFLGEPERYAEAVTPWAAIAAGSALFQHGGPQPLALLVGLFLGMDLLQLHASKMLQRIVSGKGIDLDEIARAVERSIKAPIRFCSNNEHFTKLLMEQDWQFAYCLAVGERYAGMKAFEAFSIFPLLKQESCERIASTYRVNACLLDRELYDSIFATRPADLRAMSVVFESARLKVVALDWADPAPAV